MLNRRHDSVVSLLNVLERQYGCAAVLCNSRGGNSTQDVQESDPHAATKGKGKGKDLDIPSTFLGYLHRCPHVLKSIDAYILEHASSFADISAEGEFKLEHKTIFDGYIALLDKHVAAFLEFMGINETEFLEALAKVQGQGEAEWRPFKALLNKADYMTFVKMMQTRASGKAS